MLRILQDSQKGLNRASICASVGFMSVRLKNHWQCPPGGFHFFQAQTGWESAKADPPSQWDFKRLCTALQAHRKANPRFNLPTDMQTITEEVDTTNAMRVQAIPRAESYIVVSPEGSAFSNPTPKSLRPSLSKLGVAVGAGSKYLAGGKLFIDWLGEGGVPVIPELANQRAAVCATCPKNTPGDWTQYFTDPVVAAVKRQIEFRNDLKLSTTNDEKLGTCQACLCVLTLKVHTPIQHIVKHMPPEVKKELVPQCWVLAEGG